MALRPRKPAGDEIPTSSMADIAFLLLIFFMVTTTFAATRGLDFQMDTDDPSPPAIDRIEAVMVQVQADGGLLVDQQPMVLAGLMPYLSPRLQQAPSKPVILDTDPAAPYGSMVQVLDELRRGEAKLGLPEGIRLAIPTAREKALYWR